MTTTKKKFKSGTKITRTAAEHIILFDQAVDAKNEELWEAAATTTTSAADVSPPSIIMLDQQYSPPTATTTINNNVQSANINNLIEILIDNNNSIQNAMNSINNLFSNQNVMLLNLLNELKKRILVLKHKKN
ncbi:unnamed protein product [Rotaria socialis]|uniref:Uncharacterized protein n=1 Tax=Rotaria socialis TaxID=392032 RepID=A0A818YJH7_9BILA|nr:unnamed protein product [Rotaria socialis]CAF4482607.1 unnamed protein product [Rotaria socialis]